MACQPRSRAARVCDVTLDSHYGAFQLSAAMRLAHREHTRAAATTQNARHAFQTSMAANLHRWRSHMHTASAQSDLALGAAWPLKRPCDAAKTATASHPGDCSSEARVRDRGLASVAKWSAQPAWAHCARGRCCSTRRREVSGEFYIDAQGGRFHAAAHTRTIHAPAQHGPRSHSHAHVPANTPDAIEQANERAPRATCVAMEQAHARLCLGH